MTADIDTARTRYWAARRRLDDIVEDLEPLERRRDEALAEVHNARVEWEELARRRVVGG